MRSEVPHFWSWFLQHDGSFCAAIDLIEPRTAESGELGHVLYFWLVAVAARVVAFGAALQHRLGIVGSSLAVIESGPLTALMFDDGGGLRRTSAMQEPPTRVRYAFAMPIRSGTADAIATETAVFGQRVHDGTGQGLDIALPNAIKDYLEALLPW